MYYIINSQSSKNALSVAKWDVVCKRKGVALAVFLRVRCNRPTINFLRAIFSDLLSAKEVFYYGKKFKLLPSLEAAVVFNGNP